jgi:hypothetical protein
MNITLTKNQAIKAKSDLKSIDGRHEIKTKFGTLPLLLITPIEMDGNFIDFINREIFTGNTLNEFDYLDKHGINEYRLNIVFTEYPLSGRHTTVASVDFFEWIKEDSVPLSIRNYDFKALVKST